MGNALHTPGAPGAPGPVDAAQARLDDAGLIAVQGPSLLDVRTGVGWGPGSTALVTGTASTAPMKVSIATHHWFTSRQAVDGVYRGAAEAVKLVDIGAAPASGTRTDTVWVKQNDANSTITPDGTTEPVYGVTPGTPGKAPIPVGATELSTVAVSAGATATNGANVVITNTARQTVARGADVPVRSAAERDALAPFWPLLTVKRLDTGAIEMRNAANTAWLTVYDPAPAAAPGCELTGTATQPIPTGAWTNVSWDAETADPRGMHSLVSNLHRVVVPETRWYTVTATAYWDATSTGRRGVRIVRNDDTGGASTNKEVLLGAIVNMRESIAAGIFLTAGDYVGIQVFQDTGAARDLTRSNSHMSVVPGSRA